MWQPTALLLGPGGVKGFMELGFLLYMEERNLLKPITSLSGVSVGAIISLLLTAGYNVYEIINESFKTNFFQDISSIHLQDIWKNVGVLSHEQIQTSLEKLIIAKFGKVLTMWELYQATGIELYITSLRLHPTNPQPVHFSHITEPNISCVEAVLLSLSIPGIFHRRLYKDHYYIDGALGDSYPIHLLDNGQEVLGLYIAPVFKDYNSIISYIQQVFYAGLIQLRNIAIKHASSHCQHIALTSTNHDIVGIATGPETRMDMVSEGYDTAKKFFEDSSLLVSPDEINLEEIYPSGAKESLA